MSEIIMIKSSSHSDIEGMKGLPLEAVVGIARDNTRTILEHGYRLDGNESEEVLTLPYEKGERLAYYFNVTQARDPSFRIQFNCHSFMGFVSGFQDTPIAVDGSRYNVSPQAEQDRQLSPGVPYGLITARNEHVHSLLGIDRPAYGISVLGTNNPLVVAANGLLRHMYSAQHIAQVEGAAKENS